ncbi:mannose-1-phosphate guanylyltransferase/mannose-6-phosphate isomerase [Pseudaestuariivita atlantica]|uniref:mannose-1-phosphate guanylyltransferase n=1 Tax=Pseudaestuariivita atlantica TaxID=1317121 RepID=A0A0L1JP21_9RHOB|nr:mannose-1-phosphate guanylyltransferase/mannose-6-phosphate isomerase [Pseudaestuariivita atlantica]KNG93476.1 mannose-1-phosphate guanyltransferase [Pseudaestuariivita atlantica]
MHDIQPVILCGGSGTRLWPLSRKSYPKQFAALVGERSLFQDTALRVSGEGFGAPLVVTASDFRFIATQQLAECGVDPGAVLIEPSARNTAPALLAAALKVEADTPGALMLALPSDHLIPDAAAFREAVQQGVAAARDGVLVTFGIRPHRPETGYGYLKLGKEGAGPVVPLERFVEKPDEVAARRMLDDGGYLWNAGIFLMSARALIAAFEAHAPQVLSAVRAAVDHAEPDLGFLRLEPEAWSRAPDISIDYAIMEKAERLGAVPFEGEWSDLGDWAAIWRQSGADEAGVGLHGPAHAIDCRDTLLRSEAGGQVIVGLGLEDIVAVALPDAVLVAHRDRAQDVKQAVDRLKAAGAPQATAFPKDHRPWGYFETLTLADRFQVKRIVVNPGAALSLQSHVHRSEHWIVVAGTARVTVDNVVSLVAENQSIYVPLGAVHRMENPGKVPMVLIEVQTGAYLGEDDIVRYEDLYARRPEDGNGKG